MKERLFNAGGGRSHKGKLSRHVRYENKMERVQLISWIEKGLYHFKETVLKNSPRRHQECIKKTKNYI